MYARTAQKNKIIKKEEEEKKLEKAEEQKCPSPFRAQQAVVYPIRRCYTGMPPGTDGRLLSLSSIHSDRFMRVKTACRMCVLINLLNY